MEKYKHGLILGKFYPPHKGHYYLIESAKERCEKLTVLICSLGKETIPGVLRYTWLKDEFPELDIKHIIYKAKYEEPSVDDDENEFWNVWITAIKDYSKNVDVVFTSETYGDELVKRMNASGSFEVNHHLVDLFRKTVPVSGTEIRSNPFKFWNYIPEKTRYYFVKKVALVGPESVGKSTMTKLLASYFNTNYVKEYGRDYYDFLKNNDIKFTPKHMEDIVRGHKNLEIQMEKHSNKLLFCDTEVLTSMIWSEIFFNEVPEKVKEKSNEYLYDLYLLLTPEVEWFNDGTRQFENSRDTHYTRIKKELDDRGLPYFIVKGENYDNRFGSAMDFVQGFFGLNTPF